MNPFEPPVAEIKSHVGVNPVRKWMLVRYATFQLLAIAYVLIFYFIIPKFEAIFADFGAPLPRLTVFAIELSHLVNMYVVMIVPCLLLWSLYELRETSRTENGAVRKRWLSGLLRLMMCAMIVFAIVALSIPLLSLHEKLSG